MRDDVDQLQHPVHLERDEGDLEAAVDVLRGRRVALRPVVGDIHVEVL